LINFEFSYIQHDGRSGKYKNCNVGFCFLSKYLLAEIYAIILTSLSGGHYPELIDLVAFAKSAKIS
jgi:hypothetical protein